MSRRTVLNDLYHSYDEYGIMNVVGENYMSKQPKLTFLEHVCANREYDIAYDMIKSGFNCDVSDSGCSAVGFAIFNQAHEDVEKLIQAGANPAMAHPITRNTLLHFQVCMEHIGQVSNLINSLKNTLKYKGMREILNAPNLLGASPLDMYMVAIASKTSVYSDSKRITEHIGAMYSLGFRCRKYRSGRFLEFIHTLSVKDVMLHLLASKSLISSGKNVFLPVELIQLLYSMVRGNEMVTKSMWGGYLEAKKSKA